MRGLDERDDEHETSRRQVHRGRRVVAVEAEEHGDQRPGEARLDDGRTEHEPHRGQHDRGEEHQQGQLRKLQRDPERNEDVLEGLRNVGQLRAHEQRDSQWLPQDQAEDHPAGPRGERALGQPGECRQVEGEQQRDGGEHDATDR